MENQLQLVTFEQAKKLKALGFDWPTHEAYRFEDGEPLGVFMCIDALNHNEFEDTISSPTVALALKWCRDVKVIYCSAEFHGFGKYGKNPKYAAVYYIYKHGKEAATRFPALEMLDTYEAAESSLLDELLNVLETNKL